MYLTTHSTIGIAIATKTLNPWFGFIFALIAHYLVDTIPHGDESVFSGITPKQKYSKIFTALVIDLIITSLVVFFIFTKVPINPVIMLAAILGSILPDILWGLHDVTNIKILKPFAKIHSYFHNPLKKEFSLAIGIILQVIIIALVIIFAI